MNRRCNAAGFLHLPQGAKPHGETNFAVFPPGNGAERGTRLRTAVFPADPAVGHTLARHRHDDTADALLADDDCRGIPAYGRAGCRQPETHPACDDAPRTFGGDIQADTGLPAVTVAASPSVPYALCGLRRSNVSASWSSSLLISYYLRIQ